MASAKYENEAFKAKFELLGSWKSLPPRTKQKQCPSIQANPVGVQKKKTFCIEHYTFHQQTPTFRWKNVGCLMSWVEIFQEVVKAFYRNLAHRLWRPVARRAANFPPKVEHLKEQWDPSDKKIFLNENKIHCQNLRQNVSVAGEELIFCKGIRLRVWVPTNVFKQEPYKRQIIIGDYMTGSSAPD